jgi:hypothetical protein
VTLLLVPSKEPGTLDLKDFNFDDLLARRKHLGRSTSNRHVHHSLANEWLQSIETDEIAFVE